ncbi:1134_t:CDS:1 [Acaulospora morrowiae]|uniref:1134_t:CDS:1 n=1 Tax=Acaulospora morrowiae TaxID=94023 RepID=A0A9N9BPM0_9GLOM|nr:1134_t:CDS:1 [Acaulospora morrowiae]
MENIENTTNESNHYSFERWFNQPYSFSQYFPYVKFAHNILHPLEETGYMHVSLKDLEQIKVYIQKLCFALEFGKNATTTRSREFLPKGFNVSRFNSPQKTSHQLNIHNSPNERDHVDFKTAQSESLLGFLIAQLLDQVDFVSKYWQFKIYEDAKYKADAVSETLSVNHENSVFLHSMPEFISRPENTLQWLKRFNRKSIFRSIVEEEIAIIYNLGDRFEHIVTLQSYLRSEINPFKQFTNGKRKQLTPEDANIWIIMTYMTMKLLEKIVYPKNDHIFKRQKSTDSFIREHFVRDLEELLATCKEFTLDERWIKSEDSEVESEEQETTDSKDDSESEQNQNLTSFFLYCIIIIFFYCFPVSVNFSNNLTTGIELAKIFMLGIHTFRMSYAFKLSNTLTKCLVINVDSGFLRYNNHLRIFSKFVVSILGIGFAFVVVILGIGAAFHYFHDDPEPLSLI